MKTNPLARRLVRIRLILTCLAIASVVGVEFGIGQSLATRIGQNTACQTEAAQSPELTMGDLMAASR